ncbi:MAG: hypothetical protein Q4G36_12930 [Paracoccus sp. (in: a-proteobacteria)]|nr:hypothetical protein [Paracoccus sp. (in: a-proteobacteria)]
MAVVVLLSGCGDASAPVNHRPPPCIAQDYRQLIGQVAPAMTVPEPYRVRAYLRGTALTEDYDPFRLNFEFDGDHRLLVVTCG